MLKTKDLRGQTKEELETKIDEIEMEFFQLKSKLKTERKLEKPHLLKEKRRDRARILTVMRQRKLHAKKEG